MQAIQFFIIYFFLNETVETNNKSLNKYFNNRIEEKKQIDDDEISRFLR